MWSQVSLECETLGTMSTNKGTVDFDRIMKWFMIFQWFRSRTNLKQMSQWKGLPFVWSFLWFLRVDLSLKTLPQAVHENGFSPVWTFICYFRYDTQTNVYDKSCRCDRSFSSHFHPLRCFKSTVRRRNSKDLLVAISATFSFVFFFLCLIFSSSRCPLSGNFVP